MKISQLKPNWNLLAKDFLSLIRFNWNSLLQIAKTGQIVTPKY